jgi:serine/threonine protein kinase
MQVGQELLHYRLVEKLGEGGMGVVWRAVDTTLDREVALKVLPEAFGADADRVARFEREARLLASLNHPNVAALYGLHEAEGQRFLTMELVEGETLASHLSSGPLPSARTFELARQIAEALEAAHESGVVHRDLKPANVMIGPEDRVKVLDFGLAKAFETVSGVASGDHSLSPTLTTAGTVAGVILGTAAYMSPEQARGHAADTRSDVWSLGCILWEMITGTRLFRGETASDTLAAVLRADPEWETLPETTPLRVRELLGRCLDRDRRSRLQAVGEARITLERVLADPDEDDRRRRTAAALPRARASRLPWVLVGILTLLAVALSFLPCLWGDGDAGGRIRSIIMPPPGAVEFAHTQDHSGALSVSPDGRYMTFAEAEIGDPGRLWLRPLDGSPARPLPGTEGASFPFWSPDSRHIAFFADDKLKRIDLEGSPPVTLCEAPNGRSGGWSEAGVIIFSPTQNEPIHRVAAGGGTPEPITELDEEAGESTHRWATFLPDGKSFLYMAGGHSAMPDDEVNAVWAGRLGSEERRRILGVRSNVVFAEGHLIYVRDEMLMARPFDPEGLEFTGDPFPLSDNVIYDVAYFRGAFAAAGEVLVHARGEILTERELHWVDMASGTVEEEILGDPARILTVEISPDDRYAALVIEEPETARNDLWIQDLERGTRSRFTFDPRNEHAPVWSPDSDSLVYATVEGERWTLYLKSVTGGGDAQVLLEPERRIIPSDWTRDGYLVAEVDSDGDPATNDDDVIAIPLEGGGPFTVVDSPEDQSGPVVSPDGRWVLYTSFESGRPEAFLAPFPGPGRKYQVTTDGAFGATWDRAGEAVIAIAPDLTVLRIPVEEMGGRLEIGRPEAVFRDARAVDGDVSHVSARALLVLDPAQQESIPVTLDLNWAERGEGR